MSREPLSRQLHGRWAAILPAFGVDAKALDGKQHPCPLCGGKDRFRFDNQDGRGTWYCNHCGAGDGVKLVMAKQGWDFREAKAEIDRIAGTAPYRPGKPAHDSKPTLLRLWGASVALEASPAARAWWTARMGELPVCGDLRAMAAMFMSDDNSRWPGMVAKVRDVDGHTVALHRTYLTPQGGKPCANHRKLLGRFPPGAAVRLAAPTDIIGVAEGLETALSAARLFGVPVWAALNAGGIERWVPPAGVASVVIFGDRDANYVGQAAAYALAKRLHVLGLHVSVELPDRMGEDWNDVWQSKRRAA